jgi:hypothetical protein
MGYFHKIKGMEIQIDPQTLERAEERRTNEKEIRDVINTGFSVPGKYGRITKALRGNINFTIDSMGHLYWKYIRISGNKGARIKAPGSQNKLISSILISRWPDSLGITLGQRGYAASRIEWSR